MRTSRSRIVTAGLIVVSAITFASGVAVERNGEHHESRPAAAATAAAPGADNGHDATANTDSNMDADGDHAPAPRGDDADTPSRPEQAGVEADSHAEDFLGINTESTPLVAAAVIASVVLAGALLAFGSPLLAALIGLAMAGFTAFDVREVVHQLDTSHTGLAVLALAVAMLHLLATGGAIATARTAARSRPA